MTISWRIVAEQHHAIMADEGGFQSRAEQLTHPPFQLVATDGGFHRFRANHHAQSTDLGGTRSAAPRAGRNQHHGVPSGGLLLAVKDPPIIPIAMQAVLGAKRTVAHRVVFRSHATTPTADCVSRKLNGVFMPEAEQVAMLLGTAGMAEGESYVLTEGIEIVIGRSRSCPVSMRRAANYLRASASVRDNDHDFNTVSRRHVRLFVAAGKVDIEDLSSNGTFVGGEALTGRTTVDLSLGPCSLRLGTRERFDIQLVAKDDPRIAGKEPLQSERPGAAD